MVVGPDKKTVITLDMALYEKAKQLEMSREDCKGKWVLGLGEMHTVMAALRATGSVIEDSGLNEAWGEADMYMVQQRQDRSLKQSTWKRP